MPTRLLSIAFAVALMALAAPGQAQTSDAPATAEATVPALAMALQLDDLFAVLRDEGIAQGETLEEDMFPGGGGTQWDGAIAAIYDTPTLRSRFEAVLDAELGRDPAILAAILDFYATDLGKRVVLLEIEARRAFLDTATEEAARVAADNRAADRDPKVALLRSFIEAGDLIEMNVAGALSGNLAFMSGMAESGLYGTMPEEQMMSDVWAQEGQVRDDTTSWLYAYLGLAYDPLTESELQSYIDFMESPEGRRLNAALFVAFDQVFRQVSHDLGRAAGVAIQGRDI